jgi:hypothetical protein
MIRMSSLRNCSSSSMINIFPGIGRKVRILTRTVLVPRLRDAPVADIPHFRPGFHPFRITLLFIQLKKINPGLPGTHPRKRPEEEYLCPLLAEDL